MPEHVMEYVRSRRVSQQEYRTLDEVLPETDILYMTRIQRERFSSQEEYDKVICTQALLNKSLCLAQNDEQVLPVKINYSFVSRLQIIIKLLGKNSIILCLGFQVRLRHCTMYDGKQRNSRYHGWRNCSEPFTKPLHQLLNLIIEHP